MCARTIIIPESYDYDRCSIRAAAAMTGLDTVVLWRNFPAGEEPIVGCLGADQRQWAEGQWVNIKDYSTSRERPSREEKHICCSGVHEWGFNKRGFSNLACFRDINC